MPAKPKKPSKLRKPEKLRKLATTTVKKTLWTVENSNN